MPSAWPRRSGPVLLLDDAGFDIRIGRELRCKRQSCRSAPHNEHVGLGRQRAFCARCGVSRVEVCDLRIARCEPVQVKLHDASLASIFLIRAAEIPDLSRSPTNGQGPTPASGYCGCGAMKAASTMPAGTGTAAVSDGTSGKLVSQPPPSALNNCTRSSATFILLVACCCSA